LKIGDGLFLRTFNRIKEEYPEIESWDNIVDAQCMQLVTRWKQFDVLVMPNLYGDIVSDLCAGMMGGLGVAPGANYGTKAALFEAVHGSAPKYAGMNKANPTALLSGVKTYDLGGTATTSEYAEAIAAALKG